MKYSIEESRKNLPPPLKLLGKRVLISLELIPFMNMLNPLALSLATLRNPPGMIYTRKVFKYMKKVMLIRTFKKRFLKNEQMIKFLLRGYQCQFNERKEVASLYPQINKRIRNKFNINSIKKYFEEIEKYENEQQYEGMTEKLTFLQSIPITLERRRQSNFQSCLRMKKILEKIIKSEKSKEYQECERLYRNEFLKVRIPWTENIYEEIKCFGEELWQRYKNNEYNLISAEREILSEETQSAMREETQEVPDDLFKNEPPKIEKKTSKKEKKEKKEIKETKEKKEKPEEDEETKLLNKLLNHYNQDDENTNLYFSSFESDIKSK